MMALCLYPANASTDRAQEYANRHPRRGTADISGVAESGQISCSLNGMSHTREAPGLDKRLQVLDVSIVDVLSHLEALLRQSHSIQRGLLQLRSEAPPPPLQLSDKLNAELTGRSDEMHREWAMLGDIIRDLRTGIHAFKGESDISERRSGLDRRHAETTA